MKPTTESSASSRSLRHRVRRRIAGWRDQLRRRILVADVGGSFLPLELVKELDYQKNSIARGMYDNDVTPEQMTELLREYWTQYRFLPEILEHIQPQGKRVLDAGCGIFAVSRILENCECVAVDRLLKYYRRFYPHYAGIECHHGRLEQMPFPEGEFDIIFCSNTIDCIELPHRAMKEMTRVLKPDGFLVLTAHIFENSENGRVRSRKANDFDEASLLDLLYDYEVVFRKLSSIRPQVRKFVLGMPRVYDGQELIVVGRKPSSRPSLNAEEQEAADGDERAAVSNPS